MALHTFHVQPKRQDQLLLYLDNRAALTLVDEIITRLRHGGSDGEDVFEAPFGSSLFGIADLPEEEA